MALVTADPESSDAWLSLLLPGQSLVLSHLDSQHVTVSGAWVEIRKGSSGGMQASQALAQRPLPAERRVSHLPEVWFCPCPVGGNIIVAGSWEDSAYRVVSQEGEERVMVGAQ